MLGNSILDQLNIDDLNQRYQRTYIPYNKRIRFCSHFIDRTTFNLDGKIVLFDWRLLDISRPKSQWFLTDQGPFYLLFYAAHQFKRGYCDENCSIVSYNLRTMAINSVNLTNLHFAEPFKKLKFTTDEVSKNVAKVGYSFLSPTMVVTNTAILFRVSSIGTFINGVFNLNRPEFSQELHEAIYNPVIKEIKHPTIPTKISKKPLGIVLDAFDGIGAIDWDREQEVEDGNPVRAVEF